MFDASAPQEETERERIAAIIREETIDREAFHVVEGPLAAADRILALREAASIPEHAGQRERVARELVQIDEEMTVGEAFHEGEPFEEQPAAYRAYYLLRADRVLDALANTRSDSSKPERTVGPRGRDHGYLVVSAPDERWDDWSELSPVPGEGLERNGSERGIDRRANDQSGEVIRLTNQLDEYCDAPVKVEAGGQVVRIASIHWDAIRTQIRALVHLLRGEP